MQSNLLFIWEIESGKLIKSWEAHYKGIRVVKTDKSGNWIISGGEDGIINIWSLAEVIDLQIAKPTAKYSYTEHTMPINCIYCAENGRIISGSEDRSCKVWKMGDKKPLQSTLLFDSSVSSVTMDPIEKYIFVGTEKGKIFQIETYKDNLPKIISSSLILSSLFSYGVHASRINDLKVSEDSLFLISGASDGK